MKLILMLVVSVASSAVFSHTGDHQGLWHDHGQMAQSIAFMAVLLGLFAMAARARFNVAAKQKAKIDNTRKSKATD